MNQINENADNTNKINPLMPIFSIPLQYMKWFFSLPWYVILLTVIFGLFFIFQLEYSIETRRKKKELKKEGMQVKGIIKDPNADPSPTKKHVSFSDNSNIFTTVYNLWILPSLYALHRNVGL